MYGRRSLHKVALVLLVALVALDRSIRKRLPWMDDRDDRLENDDAISDFDAAGPSTVTFESGDSFEFVDGDDLEPDPLLEEPQPTALDDGPSRPLPYLEIHRPTADRGAEGVREHLDGKRCIFCKVPVAEDGAFVQTDKFGMLVTKPICKGHSEHPESWHRAANHNAEAMVYCPSCGDVTQQDTYSEECSTCDPVELETRNERRL